MSDSIVRVPGGISDADVSASTGPANVLQVTVGGTTYEGWLEHRITRGIERMPSDFEVSVSNSFPGQNTNVIAKPGDPVHLAIGGNAVLTGYLDRLNGSLSPEQHIFRLSGRGKCQDLVDCSALVQGMTVSGNSVGALAQQLVAKFQGINATSNSDGTGVFFAFNIDLGMTPYEILEEVARYEAVLVYEGADGGLIIDRVGTQTHSSGVVEGKNLQAAQVMLSMDQRFSEYHIGVMSTDRWSTAGLSGNEIAVVKDAQVPRYRPKIIVSEQGQTSQALALQRGSWEMARRRGRSQVVTAVVDSWFDSGGTLWQPNYLIPVSIPACKILGQTLCISEVTYQQDLGGGTTARLVMMPPEAFTPQPANPTGLIAALNQSTPKAGSRSTASATSSAYDPTTQGRGDL